MTKEDYIKKHSFIEDAHGYDVLYEEDVSQIMSDYGKQQAIEFNKYAMSLCWYDVDTGLWNTYDKSADPFRFTTEELYSQFIESQQTKDKSL